MSQDFNEYKADELKRELELYYDRQKYLRDRITVIKDGETIKTSDEKLARKMAGIVVEVCLWTDDPLKQDRETGAILLHFIRQLFNLDKMMNLVRAKLYDIEGGEQ